MNDYGNELPTVEQWIFETLTHDPTITSLVGNRVFVDHAPKTAEYPFIKFESLWANDVRGIGAIRIMTKPMYLIRAIDHNTSLLALKQVADRIDILFHANLGGDVSLGVMASERINPFTLTEEDGGEVFKHLGGQYRIYAKGV